MIVTFYSYKGGTGRTMALANIACLLAERQKRVLAIDFDLEAPGLWRYFSQYADRIQERQGLIDLLTAAKSRSDVNWRDYVTDLHFHRLSMSLMTSGKSDAEYPGKVLDFDWTTFFLESEGGDFIERMRGEWKAEYDYILVDSRTGITDAGGICTILLPDVIVPVFVSNRQSIEGVVDVVERAQSQRTGLAYDRPPVAVLPILSRFDSRTEFEAGQEWLDIAASRLSTFYEDWLPKEFDVRRALERTKLPYVAYFSFGEKLPVLAQGVSDPDSLGYALNTIAQLIEGQLGNATAVMAVPGADFVAGQRAGTGAKPPAKSRADSAARSWLARWREFDRRHRLRVFAARLAIILLVAAVAFVAGHASGKTSPPRSRPSARAAAWIYHPFSSVDSSPVIANGVLYVADDSGILYALNARTGILLWEVRTRAQIDSRPLVADNIVFVGNDAGKFYALDAATGKIEWIAIFVGGIDSSPAIDQGVVYVGDGNNDVNAISAANGRRLWTFVTGGTVGSSPAVRRGVVYVGSEDHKVYALAATTGRLIWARRTGGSVESSPAVADGTVYIGSGDHRVYALDAGDGAVKWTVLTHGAVTSSPFVYAGVVYVGSNDHSVYAIRANTGHIVWIRQTGSAVFSSPVVAKGTLYVGSADGKLYALSAASGQVLWSFQTGGEVNSSPALADGSVYVGSDNNEVIAIPARGQHRP